MNPKTPLQTMPKTVWDSVHLSGYVNFSKNANNFL